MTSDWINIKYKIFDEEKYTMKLKFLTEMSKENSLIGKVYSKRSNAVFDNDMR
jgi:hypothetical protein